MEASQLIPDDHNLNKGTDAGREMLPQIIEKYGFGRSVLVDKDDRLIAGNKATASAIEAGITKTIIVESDGDAIIVHKRTDLSLDDMRGRELAAADNRASEIGLEWDAQQVALLQEQGADFSLLWTETEMNELLAQVTEAAGPPPPVPPDDFRKHDEDIETKHECPACGYKWS